MLLNINADGMSPFINADGSSKVQFWPIQISLANRTEIAPMVVAIFSGKQVSAETFLRQFVDELKLLRAFLKCNFILYFYSICTNKTLPLVMFFNSA